MGRKRKLPLTSFGEFLERIQTRDKKRKTWGQIRKWLQDNPGHKLTSSQLTQDKTGRNESIPKARLELYSALFDVDYGEVVREWVRWQYDAELHTSAEVKVVPYPPDPNVAAICDDLQFLASVDRRKIETARRVVEALMIDAGIDPSKKEPTGTGEGA